MNIRGNLRELENMYITLLISTQFVRGIRFNSVLSHFLVDLMHLDSLLRSTNFSAILVCEELDRIHSETQISTSSAYHRIRTNLLKFKAHKFLQQLTDYYSLQNKFKNKLQRQIDIKSPGRCNPFVYSSILII